MESGDTDHDIVKNADFEKEERKKDYIFYSATSLISRGALKTSFQSSIFFWRIVLYEWNKFVDLQHEESKSRSKRPCTSVNYFAISSHLFTLQIWKLKLFAV